MAKIPSAHILRDFVDRTHEFSEFQGLLTGSARRIMTILGPGGIGKSLLLSRMMDECERRDICWVYIGWEDSRRFSYLDVMRAIRDGTDPSLFQFFNDRVNFYTVPDYQPKIQFDAGAIQNIQVLSSGQVKDSEVDVSIGHKFEIKDLHISVPRPDRSVTEDDVIIELTRAFVPCLVAFTSARPLVLFLDGLEKAATVALTLNWLRGELLTRVRDLELPQLLVVMAGRNVFDLDPSFFDCVVDYELNPFRELDIDAYLGLRGVASPGAADWVYALSDRGNPLKVAQTVDAYIQVQRRKSTVQS